MTIGLHVVPFTVVNICSTIICVESGNSLAHVCNPPCLSMRNNAPVEHCVAEASYSSSRDRIHDEDWLHRTRIINSRPKHCAIKNKT